MSRQESRADQKLAAEATALLATRRPDLGLEVSPRQVRRWREEHEVLDNDWWSIGGLAGSDSTYVPQAIEAAAEYAILLHFLEEAPPATCALFYRGYAVRDEPLKRAYDALLNPLIEGLRTLKTKDSQWEAAEDATKVVMKSRGAWDLSLRQRLRGHTPRPGVVIKDMLLMFVGDPLDLSDLSDEGTPGVVVAMGMESAWRENPQRLARYLTNLPMVLIFEAMRESISGASEKGLEEARDAVKSNNPLLTDWLSEWIPPEVRDDPDHWAALSDVFAALFCVPAQLQRGNADLWKAVIAAIDPAEEAD